MHASHFSEEGTQSTEVPAEGPIPMKYKALIAALLLLGAADLYQEYVSHSNESFPVLDVQKQ